MEDLFTSAVIFGVLLATLRIATPLLLAALGELVCESSGILNLSLEGTMTMGAFAGFYIANETGSTLAGLVAAGLGGAFLSLIMALMTVTAKVNQVVAGLALNILGLGLAFFWYRSIYEAEGSIDIPTVETMSVPWLTYLAFVMVPVVWVFLYRTKYGLELRSVGHNPEACDMRGVGIISRQYVAVLFGGVMAGLAGSFLSLGSTGLFFPDIISGRGWIALAIVIFGNWRATWVLVGSLLFGFPRGHPARSPGQRCRPSLPAPAGAALRPHHRGAGLQPQPLQRPPVAHHPLPPRRALNRDGLLPARISGRGFSSE